MTFSRRGNPDARWTTVPALSRTSIVGVPHNVESAYEVELRLGIDVHRHDPVDNGGDVSQQDASRTAGGAERAGELMTTSVTGPRLCSRRWTSRPEK